MRRRTRILAAVALLLVVANVILYALSRPRDDYNDEEVAMWFGWDQSPLSAYRNDNWPIIKRPMVVIQNGHATRGGRVVEYTDLVDNIGQADMAAERQNCSVLCIQPWLAFARAGPTARIADIAAAVRAVRSRCNIEVVIFDGLAADARGRPIFFARGADVPTLGIMNSEEAYLPDPTLPQRGVNETEEVYWDRTGCPTLNPRRA